MLWAAVLQPPMKLAGNDEQLAEIPPCSELAPIGSGASSPSRCCPSGFCSLSLEATVSCFPDVELGAYGGTGSPCTHSSELRTQPRLLQGIRFLVVGWSERAGLSPLHVADNDITLFSWGKKNPLFRKDLQD